MWYWDGTRSIWNHQVPIDLDRTPNRWVMAFPMKHYRATDEPKVQLWWTFTLRHICTYIQIMTYTCGTKWIVPKITMQRLEWAHLIINGRIRWCHVLITVLLGCLPRCPTAREDRLPDWWCLNSYSRWLRQLGPIQHVQYPISFCKIQMKHLQHMPKTAETLITYAWNT
jgi:hypothetical protein